MHGHRENLYGSEAGALGERLAALGAKPGAGQRMTVWLYRRKACGFGEMTDLPAALRADLAKRFTVERPWIARRFPSIDGTVRYLIALPSGASVEAVAIPSRRGRMTFCLSSQVGCALACSFCMTGRLGFSRHLDPGEIVGQIEALMLDHKVEPNHFNIVFMGMGEPLHNFENVVSALRILTGSDGFAIGAKRITLSTAGLAPEIERLAAGGPYPHLAVSLTATTDEVRSRLLPINRRWPIGRLLDACRVWARASGEQVFLEYVLLAGENDSIDDAARLARLASGVAERINVIPFNEAPELPHRASPDESVLAFRDVLVAHGLRASIRRSRGRDAAGACGMLAFRAATNAEDPHFP